MYATPQKINPKKESKSEDIKDSKSEKKGMTSAWGVVSDYLIRD
jgi:hypothetical protein